MPSDKKPDTEKTKTPEEDNYCPNWGPIMFRYQALSENFIEKYQDKIDWSAIIAGNKTKGKK